MSHQSCHPVANRVELGGYHYEAQRFHMSYDTALLCPKNPVIENMNTKCLWEALKHEAWHEPYALTLKNESWDLAHKITVVISAILTIHTHTPISIDCHKLEMPSIAQHVSNWLIVLLLLQFNRRKSSIVLASIFVGCIFRLYLQFLHRSIFVK